MMQMTAKNRLKDLLPVLVVFFVVSVVGTFMFFEFVVKDPVVVPAPQVTPATELPHPTPFVPRH